MKLHAISVLLINGDGKELEIWLCVCNGTFIDTTVSSSDVCHPTNAVMLISNLTPETP